MSLRDEAEFICQAPRIVFITPSLVANETSDVMLSCVAEADPAPEVVLRSPTNDQIRVSPTSGRKQTRTQAFWEQRNVRIDQSGWYSCNATNMAGSRTGFTYLHVAVPGDPPVNISDILFTSNPRPETATAASVTSHSVTSSTFQYPDITSSSLNSTERRHTTAVDFLTASASGISSAHARWTQDTGSTVGAHLTTVAGSYLATKSPSVDDAWEKALLIIGCVLGSLVFLVFLFIVVICCLRLGRKHRRRRRRAKSVPPTLRTIRDDCIRRPKPFPGVSMAVETDGQALQGSALPVSPTYSQPERLDLLAAEYDRRFDPPLTFDRRKNGGGVNGCT